MFVRTYIRGVRNAWGFVPTNEKLEMFFPWRLKSPKNNHKSSGNEGTGYP